MKRPHIADPLSLPHWGTRWRSSVMAGLAALVMLSGIAGCGDQPRAGSATTGSSLPAVSQTSPLVTLPDISSGAPPSVSSAVAAPITTKSTVAAVTPAADDPGQAALGALALLAVRDAAPQNGYRRELFGQAWSDDVTVEDGHNGCDTRNDILRRDLTAVQLKVGTNGCVVLNGTLEDPYSAQTIAFVRGAATSDAVQIDHLVALSDAWRSGAQLLTADQRQNLANDPLNLLAVSGPLNQAKGDSDAASWLPPNAAFRCRYVIRQIQVKTRYALWVESAERDAMTRILTDCGDPPVGVAAPPSSSISSGEPATVAPVQQPSVAGQTSAGDGSFANCAAARAAGAAPLLRGRPGYRDSMDGDRDGIACEN